MVRTLGAALHLSFKRVQFTPDLMPSDIVGTEILEEDHGTGKRYFKFQKGPVFTNLLLADELNRTPPKTQAALLEAMQEHTVSYGGTTYPLPEPFFVLATQNPLEQAGTYPLPEAQLDRFLLHVRIDYPSETEEQSILVQTTGTPVRRIDAVMRGEEVSELQELTREVHLGDDVLTWITRLTRATRPQDTSLAEIRGWLRWGAGPRAAHSCAAVSPRRARTSAHLRRPCCDIACCSPLRRRRSSVRRTTSSRSCCGRCRIRRERGLRRSLQRSRPKPHRHEADPTGMKPQPPE
jgi:MoxR-like ATPase